MKYDSFSLIDFMQECVKSYIPDLEMVNYMRSITKNLDTELIKTLFLDVNKLSGAIVKFIIEKSSIDNGIESTLLVETSLDVYISEKYIYLLTKKMNSEGYDVSDDCQKFEDAFCYLSVLEKLKLLKEINTKINFESIISKYGDLLKFCCLIEQEYKKIPSKVMVPNSEEKNTTFKYDVNVLDNLYNVLKTNKTINCEEHEFVTAVATANFTHIERLKIKRANFMYMISALSNLGNMQDGWYLKAATSINELPTKCSGAAKRISEKLKISIDEAIKSNKDEK